MRLMMHVLKENKKQKIDNTKIDFNSILAKLNEEFKEVVEATEEYIKNKTLSNLKLLIGETFDLIQVCILILWKCNRQAINFDEANLIQEVNIKHKDKLVSREWIFETGIEIDVKE